METMEIYNKIKSFCPDFDNSTVCETIKYKLEEINSFDFKIRFGKKSTSNTIYSTLCYVNKDNKSILKKLYIDKV